MSKSANTIQFPKGPLPPNYLTEDRGHILLAVSTAFLGLILVAFALRQASRYIQKTPWGWDDVLIIPALLVNIFDCILGIRKCSRI